MVCRRCFLIAMVLLTARAPPIWAQQDDIFDFFEAEAEAIRLVTASRLPQSARWTPATVYVVTAEDIEASGARTFWDALRGVPGVDVMATRTFYGEVSIRGLNRALGTRTLVLLDGRTVLNGPFDATFWEGLPVGLGEVDRIEVVEGPASALYGANAVNGVVNIITKAAEASGGGKATYGLGERMAFCAPISNAATPDCGPSGTGAGRPEGRSSPWRTPSRSPTSTT